MQTVTSAAQELLEEWDWDSGFPTGREVTRDTAHREGTPHEAVHLWIARNPGSDPELLFQHRAPHKQNYPDCLDITVAGHVPYGFAGSKVAKESQEEIGMVPDERRMIDLGWYRFLERTGTLYQRELQHVYLLHDNRPLDEYRFRDGEVAGIYAVRLADLRRIIAGGGSLEAEGFDGSAAVRKTFTRGNFHPQLFDRSMELYLEVVFRAIDELGASGRVAVRMPEL